MKKIKVLKLILITLICIAIMLIGFFGIYVKYKNQYIDKTGDFTLASDLKGTTVIELEVDGTINTVYYDKNGNEVEITDEETDTSEYTKKEEPVNKEENMNLQNYEKTVEILKERLKFLGTEQYSIDLNKTTGKIFISFESKYHEDVESIIPMEGKLQIKDKITEDIILDYTDFNYAETSYASTENGYTIFVSFKLNDSGLNKIKDIDKYKTVSKDTVEQDEKEEEEESKEEPQAVIIFDKEEIDLVSYDKLELLGKKLRVTTQKDITDTDTINSKLNTGTVITKLSNIGKTPLKYELIAEEYINSSIDENIIKIALISMSIILLLAIVLFIVKYKIIGLFASIGIITNIALFIIIIKTTKIAISLNCIAVTLPLIILNIMLVKNMLESLKNKEKTFKSNIGAAYLKTKDLIVIIAIAFIVFAFSSMTLINTMGLFIFWGWLVILLGTLIFTVPFLALSKNEK